MRAFYLNLLKRCRRHFSAQQPRAGFTFIEVVVASLMATIMVAGLLGLMVDLLRNNEIEQAQYQTKKEMQRALNYIANELKEAVYVYTGQELDNRGSIPGVNNFLEVNAAGVQTVLAFWKIDAVDNLPANCGSMPTSLVDECTNLLIERRTYNLVVYVQSTATSDIWSGESRIQRYELRKYDESNITASALPRSTGYVDPITQSSFARWPYDSDPDNFTTSLQAARPSETNPVLVDLVDDPTSLPSGGIPGCTAAGYTRSPLDAATSTSFFACVRNATATVDAVSKTVNQDTILYLRGNISGQLSFDVSGRIDDPSNPTNDTAVLPSVTTQVNSRSIYDKSIGD